MCNDYYCSYHQSGISISGCLKLFILFLRIALLTSTSTNTFQTHKPPFLTPTSPHHLYCFAFFRKVEQFPTAESAAVQCPSMMADSDRNNTRHGGVGSETGRAPDESPRAVQILEAPWSVFKQTLLSDGDIEGGPANSSVDSPSAFQESGYNTETSPAPVSSSSSTHDGTPGRHFDFKDEPEPGPTPATDTETHQSSGSPQEWRPLRPRPKDKLQIPSLTINDDFQRHSDEKGWGKDEEKSKSVADHWSRREQRGAANSSNTSSEYTSSQDGQGQSQECFGLALTSQRLRRSRALSLSFQDLSVEGGDDPEDEDNDNENDDEYDDGMSSSEEQSMRDRLLTHGSRRDSTRRRRYCMSSDATTPELLVHDVNIFPGQGINCPSPMLRAENPSQPSSNSLLTIPVPCKKSLGLHRLDSFESQLSDQMSPPVASDRRYDISDNLNNFLEQKLSPDAVGFSGFSADIGDDNSDDRNDDKEISPSSPLVVSENSRFHDENCRNDYNVIGGDTEGQKRPDFQCLTEQEQHPHSYPRRKPKTPQQWGGCHSEPQMFRLSISSEEGIGINSADIDEGWDDSSDDDLSYNRTDNDGDDDVFATEFGGPALIQRKSNDDSYVHSGARPKSAASGVQGGQGSLPFPTTPSHSSRSFSSAIPNEHCEGDSGRRSAGAPIPARIRSQSRQNTSEQLVSRRPPISPSSNSSYSSSSSASFVGRRRSKTCSDFTHPHAHQTHSQSHNISSSPTTAAALSSSVRVRLQLCGGACISHEMDSALFLSSSLGAPSCHRSTQTPHRCGALIQELLSTPVALPNEARGE